MFPQENLGFLDNQRVFLVHFGAECASNASFITRLLPLCKINNDNQSEVNAR